MRPVLVVTLFPFLVFSAHSAVLVRHAIENIEGWRNVPGILNSMLPPNGEMDSFLFEPGQPDNLTQEINRFPLLLAIVVTAQPPGTRPVAGGFTLLNPYLDPQESSRAQRLRSIYVQSLGGIRDVGELPFRIITSLAVPHILLALPSDASANEVATQLAIALQKAFPGRFQTMSPTREREIPELSQPTVRGTIQTLTSSTEPISSQTRTYDESHVREEILSWIRLESDDESWMDAFRAFESPPEPQDASAPVMEEPSVAAPAMTPPSEIRAEPETPAATRSIKTFEPVLVTPKMQDRLPRPSPELLIESSEPGGIISADMAHIQAELEAMARHLNQTSKPSAPASTPTSPRVLPRPNWLILD